MSETETMLIMGDCTTSLKQVEENSIDLILTDPPYNIGLHVKKRGSSIDSIRPGHFTTQTWDDQTLAEWIEMMDQTLAGAARTAKEGANMVSFMSYNNLSELISLAEKHGFYLKTVGVWHKTNPMPRNWRIGYTHSIEHWAHFVYATKRGTFNTDSPLHDHVETACINKKERSFGHHPTQKPLRLIEHFVETLSNRGDTILDPFMGSGTTGVAAKKLGRHFVGLDIDEDYFRIARERIDHTERTLL